MKLGKRPAVHDPRALLLGDYLTNKSLAMVPSAMDWGKIATWPMLGNERYSDCAFAMAGHQIQAWTTIRQQPFVPTEAQILEAYGTTGFRPDDPSTDQGTIMTDLMKTWRTAGIADHQILAYTSIEPRNRDHVKFGIWAFGSTSLGFALPLAVQGKRSWSVPPAGMHGIGAPGSWGGHAVPAVAYDARGVTVVSWGKEIHVSWRFFEDYCDEAFVPLSASDWVEAGARAPSGFDLQALRDDLKSL